MTSGRLLLAVVGAGAGLAVAAWGCSGAQSSLGGSDAGHDSAGGSIGGPSVTDDPFQPPSDPGDGLAWIVVHDNRGGASWITVPIHVE